MSQTVSYSSKWICAADFDRVHVYAASTLKRVRVLQPSEDSIVAISASPMDPDTDIVVVDTQGVVTTLNVETGAVSSQESITATKKSKGTVQFAQVFLAPANYGAMQLPAAEPFAMVLAATSVLAAPLRGASKVAFPAATIPAKSEPIAFGVGQRTGLIAVGFARSLLCASATGAQRTIPLNLDLSVLACAPHAEQVAVGSKRGEISVLQSIKDGKFWSEHWHHTPVSALSFSVDGGLLLSGGCEPVICLWNMSSYAHSKVPCGSAGARVEAIVPVASARQASVLIASAPSRLATLSLTERKVTASSSGVHWSQASQRCRGLVATAWKGAVCVVPTGFRDTIRFYNPLTGDTLHSIHVHQVTETVVNPPKVGVRDVLVFGEGNVVVTHEIVDAAVLPEVFRVWSFDDKTHSHTETAVLTDPHNGGAVVGFVKHPNQTAFYSVGHGTAKLWGTDDKGAWRCKGLSRCPAVSNASSLTVSPDGSVLLVADDNVHAYSTHTAQRGADWPLVRTLYQTETTAPLQSVTVVNSSRAVVAYSGKHLFAWSLLDAQASPSVVATPDDSQIRAMAVCRDEAVVLVTAAKIVVHTVKTTSKGCTLSAPVRSEPCPWADVVSAVCLSATAADATLSLVTTAFGIKNVHVPLKKAAKAKVEEVGDAPAAAEAVEAAAPSQQLQTFFPASDNIDAGAGDDVVRCDTTKTWTQSVLDGPAYAAPPVSTLLSAFLAAALKQ